MQKVLQHIATTTAKYKGGPVNYGRVTSAVGLVIKAEGLNASLGQHYKIHVDAQKIIDAEVVGLNASETLLMPMSGMEGLRTGQYIEPVHRPLTTPVGPSLLGRVIDAHGQPMDGKGKIHYDEEYPIYAAPPPPLERPLIDTPLFTGIRAIDCFTSIGQGQRVGLFAGSGVGKSVLMGMIAKASSADINVIALIGERGREVREFIDEVLGEEGLKRSVVVAATSDQAGMARVKAALVATAIAEYFRDQGKNVFMLIDSVTRIAMAQREIGLASGEPPTTKGYPPSVFSLLPKLLERAGRNDKGSITGIYTVLVDNDDPNDPVADSVRSIIDGHIVLSRKLANRSHYPAIDVLDSVSRVMTKVVTKEQRSIAQRAKEMLATYRESEDLINIGAYVRGSNPKIDKAINSNEAINKFLKQDFDEWEDNTEATWAELDKIIGVGNFIPR